MSSSISSIVGLRVRWIFVQLKKFVTLMKLDADKVIIVLIKGSCGPF